jgi:hypothetical protein
MALAALDEAIAELEAAIAAVDASLDAELPVALSALADDLVAAAAALDEVTTAYAELEAPPTLLLEVPEAFRTPEADPLTLPATSGRDQVVLMVRDPESIFTWWELTASGVGRARAEHGGELVLRIYLLGEEGAEASEIRDFLVEDWLGSRTVVLDRPGVRVSSAIGFRSDRGFVHVAQSTAMRLPRRGPGTAAVRFARAGVRSDRRVTPMSIWDEGEWSRVPARDAAGAVATHRADSEALRDFTLGQAVPGTPSDLHVAGSHHLEPRR